MKRKVRQLSLEGDVIATFDRIVDAANATGTNYGSISSCCRGRIKSANGFKWAYDNSNLKLKSDPLDKLLDFLV